MRTLIKLADRFEKKIVLAFMGTYQLIQKLHDLGVGLAADPYGERNEQLATLARDVAKSAAILADKAWRSGVKGYEVEKVVDQMGDKALRLSAALDQMPNPSMKSKLDEFRSTLASIQPMDIPAQNMGTAYQGAQSNPFKGQENAETLTSEPEPSVSQEGPGATPLALEGVVNSLVQEEEPPPWQDFKYQQ